MRKNPFREMTQRLRSLDPSFLAFLQMQACFSAFLTVMNLFINTFLLKASDNANLVYIYNIILGAVQPFSMVVTVFFLRKTSPLISQRISFLLYGAAFLSMAVLGERAAQYYIPIAVVLSIAAGFYYVTWCLQIVSYTDDSNLYMSTGLINVVSSVISLTLPILTGLVLSFFVDFTGYRILFGFVLVLALLALFFSTRLAPLREFDNSRQVQLKQVAGALLSDRSGRGVMTITVFAGIREGTFSFLITMLIYQFIANEAVIGLNSTLSSICGILSASLYGIFITPKHRGKSVFLAVSVTSLVLALLYLRLDAFTLIAFSLVNSLMSNFLSVPQTNVYYSVLQHLNSIRGKGAEVHTVREFFYGTGRVAGILLLMAMPASTQGYVTAMLVLTLLQFVSGFLVQRLQKLQVSV